MLRRLLCLFSACIVLLSYSVPVFATGTEIGPYTGGGLGPVIGGGGVLVELQGQVDVVDLWDTLRGNLREDARFRYNFVSHLIDDGVCTYAPQYGGTHNFVPRRTTKDGQIGLYYVCEYCGKAYGDALEEAYQDYVSDTMGDFTSIDSRGYIWVDSSFFDLQRIYWVSLHKGFSEARCSLTPSSPSSTDSRLSASFQPQFVFVQGQSDSHTYSVPSSSSWYLDFYFSFVSPCAGVLFVSPFEMSFSSLSPAYSQNDSFGSRSSSVSAGGQVSLKYTVNELFSGNYFNHVYVDYAAMRGYIVPAVSQSSVYSSDARVSGVSSVDNSGLYGYVQDGQLYQSTVGDIYSERTNVYQNPVTGDTSNISSWAYDYSDRSYTLVTDESETITVTYGDSNVTINEGGTTYNVYYLVAETAELRAAIESHCEHQYTSAVTTAPTCTVSGVRTYACSECGSSYTEVVPAIGHDYQSAVTMAPTCLNTGIRTFTCSNCDDSYTVSLPATGHVWEVVRTVPTTYDSDTGELVQRGYTLYQCSTCGEQYRIDADSGGSSLPAPSSGGVSTGGELSTDVDSGVGKGFLAMIAHGLTEDLPEVLKAASGWFVEFPKFYGGFTSFLTAGIAGCLPDVPKMTMGFGIGMVTFIGIIRKIIGR